MTSRLPGPCGLLVNAVALRAEVDRTALVPDPCLDDVAAAALLV
jgi:hypothetical protein